MKFPKLKLSGTLKEPKVIMPEADDAIKTTSPITTPMSKFQEIKRTLSKDRNLTKRYKV